MTILHCAVDISVEWITGKIYWTAVNRIMVYDMKSSYQTLVINSSDPHTSFHQIVVDPSTR